MGFFRVVNEDEMDQEKLKQIWNFSAEEKIFDGQKVIVYPGSIMLHMRDNQVIDVIAEPGGYVYHSNIEPDSAMAEYTALFNEYLTKYEGLFGENDLAFLDHAQEITSVEQVRSLLTELAERAFPSVKSEPEPSQYSIQPYESQSIESIVSQPEENPAPEYVLPDAPAIRTTANSTPKTINMWICGECGTKNERSFCKNCGASRREDSEIYVPAPDPSAYVPKPSVSEHKTAAPKMSGMWICGECGTKNGRSFCKSCGASRPS